MSSRQPRRSGEEWGAGATASRGPKLSAGTRRCLEAEGGPAAPTSALCDVLAAPLPARPGDASDPAALWPAPRSRLRLVRTPAGSPCRCTRSAASPIAPCFPSPLLPGPPDGDRAVRAGGGRGRRLGPAADLVLLRRKVAGGRPRAQTLAFRDYAAGGRTSFATVTVSAFIGRLVRHIAGKCFPMVRYAGLFCNRWRRGYLAQTQDAMGRKESVAASEPVPWAERQEQLTGTNPLLCPCCHVPMVLAVVLFGPWEEIQSQIQPSPHVLPIPAALRTPG